MNRFICRIAIALTICMPLLAHADLITNGNFTGYTSSDQFVTLGGGSTAITGWTVTGNSVDWIGSYWPPPPTGGSSIDLDGNGPGGIKQTFSTTPDVTYKVSFYLSGNPDGPPETKTLLVTPSDSSLPFTFTIGGNSESSMNYVLESFTFTATDTTSTLDFESLDSNYPYGPVIGGVSVSAVPEPASLLLFGTGLLGIVGMIRRKLLV